jgi:hypothetical protein
MSRRVQLALAVVVLVVATLSPTNQAVRALEHRDPDATTSVETDTRPPPQLDASPTSTVGGPGFFYFTVPNSGINYHYLLRIFANGYSVPQSLRNDIAAAAAELRAHTGADIGVGPDSGSYTPAPGDIIISIDDDPPWFGCSEPFLGCGAPGPFSNGRLIAGRAAIHPGTVGGSFQRTTVFHELGHAFNLGHFSDLFQGQYQVMHPTGDPTRTSYRQGDRNGFRELVKNGFGNGHYPPNVPPSAPGTPVLTPATEGLSGSWPASNGHGKTILEYQVRVQRQGQTTEVSYSSPGPSVNVNGLLPSTAYRARVRARTSVGWSPYSSWSPYVTTLPRCTPTISDVSDVHPFCTEIRWMVESQISVGYPDGTFRPSETVTRQGLAAFLYRLAGSPPVTPNPNRFSDVPPTHPFATEIEWMAASGIAGGYADGTFRPGETVVRQAASAFLYRFAGSPPVTPNPNRFSDVPPTHPFATEIEWMAANGIASGYTDGRFGPADSVTRQASAAFLYRVNSLP